MSLVAFGSYQKYHSYQRLVKSIIVGLLLILIIYGLLPTELRFSRGIILFGTLLVTAALFLFRFVLGRGSRSQQEGLLGNILVVGNHQTFDFVKGVMQSLAPKTPLIGYVSEVHSAENIHHIGAYDQMEFLMDQYKAEEVILDLNHLTFKKAIEFIVKHKNRILCYTLPPKADFIIASQSKNTNGIFISKLNSFQIERVASKKDKRRNDLLLCGLAILLFPYLIFSSRGRKMTANVYAVLMAKKTWVGYFSMVEEQLPLLPNPVIDIAGDDFHQKRFYAEYYQAALDRKYFFRYIFYWDK
jgi:1-acyl-sn-glycerol-3-phosphate acyltransferase